MPEHSRANLRRYRPGAAGQACQAAPGGTAHTPGDRPERSASSAPTSAITADAATAVRRPPPVSKSTMTHHWRVLRESGVIYQRPAGREIHLTLRCADLDEKFPGVLKAILAAAPDD
ncbi:helix-turn-helix domain-containing protein [Saccharopolyspora sp. NPDC050389]|uniref:ArsR/SmtB family transcription factor n=1 Tax=Saccharopolyspora sp. NPDC050389 TaxID=3155516 RepID=UPI003403BFA6